MSRPAGELRCGRILFCVPVEFMNSFQYFFFFKRQRSWSFYYFIFFTQTAGETSCVFQFLFAPDNVSHPTSAGNKPCFTGEKPKKNKTGYTDLELLPRGKSH